MKKTKAYHEVAGFGEQACIVGDLILSSQRNPARKIAGLLHLLRAGHSVSAAQFLPDVLFVDGTRYGWRILEAPVLIQYARRLSRSQ